MEKQGCIKQYLERNGRGIVTSCALMGLDRLLGQGKLRYFMKIKCPS